MRIAQRSGRTSILLLKRKRSGGHLLAIAMALVGLQGAAQGADMGRILQLPASATFSSSKGIYDIERCIVLLESRGIPFIYRQPDRPDEEYIAYTGYGSAVPLVIMIKREDGTTRIEEHESRSIGSGAKWPDGLAGCF
jgi:hypothetical protein